MVWQAWCRLIGGVLVVGGAGLFGYFLLRYVRYGESRVPWQGHVLYPLAADGTKLWLGNIGIASLLAGLVVVVLPGIIEALR